MANAERSYAAALLATAESKAEAEKNGNTLTEYTEVFEQSMELRRFLLDPLVPKEAKKDALVQLNKQDASKNAINFLKLLVDKGRFNLLPHISRDYDKQLAVMLDEVIITVTSAQPLGQDETDKIRAYFTKKYSASGTRLVSILDPTIIGGMNIQVGDTLYQGSLSGRLDSLRWAIKEQIESGQ